MKEDKVIHIRLSMNTISHTNKVEKAYGQLS